MIDDQTPIEVLDVIEDFWTAFVAMWSEDQ